MHILKAAAVVLALLAAASAAAAARLPQDWPTAAVDAVVTDDPQPHWPRAFR